MAVVIFIVLAIVYFLFVKPALNPEPIYQFQYHEICKIDYINQPQYISKSQLIEIFERKVVLNGYLTGTYKLVSIDNEINLIKIYRKYHSKDTPDLLEIDLNRQEATFVCGTLSHPIEFKFS